MFRKEAIERLSAPSQLDQLVKVVSLPYWVWIVGLAVIIVSAGVWSVMGTVSTRVSGTVLLQVRTGRVFPIAASQPGLVSTIEVKAGDPVRKGQIIARVQSSELRDQLRSAKATLTALQSRLEDLRGAHKRERSAALKVRKQQFDALNTKLATAEKQRKRIQGHLEALAKLAKRGETLRRSVDQMQDSLYKAEQDHGDAKASKANVQATFLSGEADRAQEVRNAKFEILKQQLTIKRLEADLKEAETLRAPVDGAVTEVLVARNTRITPTTVVMRVSERTGKLTALGFFKNKDGKRLEPGMRVNLSPSDVEAEEYGTIMGTVVRVAPRPQSQQALEALLQNPSVAQQFTASGAPILVVIRLQADPSAPSGYKWSSGKGPPFEITDGTMGSARVIVQDQAPISLLVPFLKKLIGDTN
jgi:HlyD family secretion protein